MTLTLVGVSSGRQALKFCCANLESGPNRATARQLLGLVDRGPRAARQLLLSIHRTWRPLAFLARQRS